MLWEKKTQGNVLSIRYNIFAVIIIFHVYLFNHMHADSMQMKLLHNKKNIMR